MDAHRRADVGPGVADQLPHPHDQLVGRGARHLDAGDLVGQALGPAGRIAGHAAERLRQRGVQRRGDLTQPARLGREVATALLGREARGVEVAQRGERQHEAVGAARQEAPQHREVVVAAPPLGDRLGGLLEPHLPQPSGQLGIGVGARPDAAEDLEDGGVVDDDGGVGLVDGQGPHGVGGEVRGDAADDLERQLAVDERVVRQGLAGGGGDVARAGSGPCRRGSACTRRSSAARRAPGSGRRSRRRRRTPGGRAPRPARATSRATPRSR